MCAITGFWGKTAGFVYEELNKIGQSMTDILSHRGPDSRGTWCDIEQGLFLGHRRLAIQDLTEAGHQPMVSQCGRYILVYNGEIYNAPELRKELPYQEWRGHSDTEVILQACIHWGIDATVRKLIGMFAFAFYDRYEKQLYLVRDRLGIKPLYWGIHQQTLLFGSELKALVQHPHFIKEINKQALSSYFKYGYITAPHSIWKNIYKLKQGHYLRIDSNLNHQEICYWNLKDVIEENQKNQYLHYEEYLSEVEKLIEDSVRRRLISDVPFGAFLSGGIDSSLITAVMQKLSHRPIKTFSIGLHESQYNEAPHAKRVAEHLGTDHFEAYVTQKEALDVIPHLASMYDEPFADSSQIPTYLLSKLTRQHVTVSLSGDGGDELFVGYKRYELVSHYWKKISCIPLSVRHILSNLLHIISRIFQSITSPILMPNNESSKIQTKLSVMRNFIKQPDILSSYYQVIDLWPADQNPLLDQSVLKFDCKDIQLDDISIMQYFDINFYLPDDILHKVDRASMATGLEVRVPLLDHRLVELSWRGTTDFKLSGAITKRPLRDILYTYLPKSLIERPKMGFGIPIADWLRSDLKDWSCDLLNSLSIKQQGLLNNDIIQHRLDQHQQGIYNWHASLWGCLMFQAWKKEWLD